jgi:hypothetical protein
VVHCIGSIRCMGLGACQLQYERSAIASCGHFRWGALYGGPAWAWPWELEDGEQGCTALHLAAAQPACAALLETITRTLPPGQVQAARSVWLHGRGVVGASPAEVFALASHGGSVGDVWASHGVLVTQSSRAAASRDTVSGKVDSHDRASGNCASSGKVASSGMASGNCDSSGTVSG